jgi:uncharacterized protein (TIGR02757 family)
MKITKEFLDSLVEKYNQIDFITHDPIALPHSFSLLQDIEIVGFWSAILAWGQRKTIIKKAEELFNLMDNAPFDFIKNHQLKDRQIFQKFKHRTFNFEDTCYFLHFLQKHYQQHFSLETAFTQYLKNDDETIENALIQFHHYFTNDENFPTHTRKHISTPERNSACKRLCMFLRWMVRKDDKGVDFGIWKNIKTSQLICPLDVHVERIAREWNLISRPQTDWKTAIELTKNLQKYCFNDPVKYDFALFGYGIEKK